MARLKKIVLSGYFGYSNAGDEFILRELLKGIKRYLPDSETAVLYRKKKRNKRENFLKVNRYNPFSVLKAVARCDLLVMGGGSLIQDSSGKFTIYYYFILMAAAIIFKKNLVIFNQGIGPINFYLNRILAGYFLSSASLVIVRDRNSKKIVQKLSRGKARVSLGADPVFNIESVGAKRNGKRIGVVLRKWGGIPSCRQLRELREEFKKRGETGVLINFHPGFDRIKLRGWNIVELKKYRGVPDIYTDLRGLIGMRLHSLILGSLCSLPMVGIEYDPKVKTFCEFMGIPSLTMEEFEPCRVFDILEKEIEKNPDYTGRIKILKERLDRSWRQFASFTENL